MSRLTSEEITEARAAMAALGEWIVAGFPPPLPPPDPSLKLLSVGAYARRIGVPRPTVSRWVHDGLPTVRRDVSVKAADAWIKTNRRRSISLKRSGEVYAAEADDGAIKIGYSSDVRRRMAELSKPSYGRGQVALLASRSGTTREEAELHAQLAPHRIGGEWYRPAPEVLAVVASLRAPVAAGDGRGRP